jgi:hypothetical protein
MHIAPLDVSDDHGRHARLWIRRDEDGMDILIGVAWIEAHRVTVARLLRDLDDAADADGIPGRITLSWSKGEDAHRADLRFEAMSVAWAGRLMAPATVPMDQVIRAAEECS